MKYTDQRIRELESELVGLRLTVGDERAGARCPSGGMPTLGCVRSRGRPSANGTA
jgi:hypothetical protein